MFKFISKEITSASFKYINCVCLHFVRIKEYGNLIILGDKRSIKNKSNKI